MIGSFPDRRFQVWEFTVSHGSLLIRSPINLVRGVATNIDVIFVGVEYLRVPRFLDGLVVSQVGADGWPLLGLPAGLPGQWGKVYSLDSQGARHVVVAATCHINANTDDIFDSPFRRDGVFVGWRPTPDALREPHPEARQ